MPKGVEPTDDDTKKFEEIQRRKIKPVMSAGVRSLFFENSLKIHNKQ